MFALLCFVSMLIPGKDLLSSYDTPSQITAIEDLIAQGADPHVVLRLMCLASLTTGGIKTKVLENLKREVLQVIDYASQWYSLKSIPTRLMDTATCRY